ncbi:TIGR01244 family sulfur transferase [Pelagibacterium limicola]|uniref:TIGR01244 family sulfur transferase n=1 Tax=Pelagibacterium limicola TaxID=2791022 RepID=UPI0018B0074C|nr:TIGR01244 family sulfur transferase [Pelagibacterium limicola]
MEIRKINDEVSVAGQIQPEDVATIKAAGFSVIVNNRPDGEAPDQPSGAEIAAAAKAAGIDYVEIPMGREGVTPQMIAATRQVFETRSGPVFCYCRSGTRSTTLWALSQAGGRDAGEIITAAAHAGYDISHLAAHLDKPLS